MIIDGYFKSRQKWLRWRSQEMRVGRRIDILCSWAMSTVCPNCLELSEGPLSKTSAENHRHHSGCSRRGSKGLCHSVHSWQHHICIPGFSKPFPNDTMNQRSRISLRGSHAEVRDKSRISHASSQPCYLVTGAMIVLEKEMYLHSSIVCQKSSLCQEQFFGTRVGSFFRKEQS